MFYFYENEFLDKKNLLNICNNIKGFSIKLLLKNLNIKLSNKIIFDKGFIGKIIEFYLCSFLKNKKNICDLYKIGIEIKTIFLNIINLPIYDTCIMSFNLNYFFKLTYINSYFFNKIKKILLIPIIGEKNIPFIYRIIGQPFIYIFSKKEKIFFLKELLILYNYIFYINCNYKKTYNFYTKNLKIQIFMKKNLKKNFYKARLYIRKNFTKKIILKYKNNLI